MQNAFVESFNGPLRDECLNHHWCRSLRHAHEAIAAWRLHCDTQRPHSALGYQTPTELVARNAIERMFCRLNDLRRVATRYDQLASHYEATVLIAAIVCYWLRVWSLEVRPF